MAVRTDQMTTFTYTTYIHAAPEQIWRGLTDPAMTKRYWRHQKAGPKTFHSDWTKGSTWDLEHKDVGLVVADREQVILESDPYRRLSYAWHSFTPGWAAEVGMDEATAEAWRAEPRSKVTSDMQDVGRGVVKLTVTHDGFTPGSRVLQAISEGPVRSSARVRDDAARAVCWPAFCWSHLVVSAANEVAESQAGSRCRQEPGDVRLRRAAVAAGKRLAGRCQATLSDGRGLYGMQEVRGSNP